MKKLKSVKYIIPSLLAAGVIQSATEEENKADSSSFLDNIKSLVVGIDNSQQYTLTSPGHSSHSSHSSHDSHGSHASHSSHSSHGSYTPASVIEDATVSQQLNELDSNASLQTRNESSTPRNAILPSSPAITKTKKLQKLPKDSAEYQDALVRLQIALATKGFEVGAIDGQLKARTVAAIYEYQTASGLIPSGKPTQETFTSLGIVI